MTGITSFGAYVPFYRLTHKEMARAWGGRAGDAERAVAGADEDSVTLAVESVRDLLAGSAGQEVDGLIFASTTAPYTEKQASSIIAMAADLRIDIRTSDVGNSLRASTSAVLSAIDSANAGTAPNMIVAAADVRMGQPRSASERMFGDASAALQIGRDHVIANLIGSHSVVDEMADTWRRRDDDFTSGWEERFATSEGYQRVVRQTVGDLFERTGIGPSEISEAIFYAPDPGSLAAVAKSLGLGAAQLPDHLLSSVGSSGTAMPLLVLSSVLESAGPGEKLLVVGYGNGCDALMFETTSEIEKLSRPGRRGISGHLASKAYLDNYEQYLKFRELVETERPRRQAESTSATQTWRERDDIYRFHGHRCLSCGVIQYPRQRICIRCQTRDSFEDVRLSDKEASVFTYTLDYLNADPNPPTAVTVVDFDGGGRAHLMMTDRTLADVKIDQRVEMTFRRMFDADGIRNYYWKCRPARS